MRDEKKTKKKRGRNELSDKKELIRLFIRRSKIEKAGGPEALREELYKHIDSKN